MPDDTILRSSKLLDGLLTFANGTSEKGICGRPKQRVSVLLTGIVLFVIGAVITDWREQ